MGSVVQPCPRAQEGAVNARNCSTDHRSVGVGAVESVAFGIDVPEQSPCVGGGGGAMEVLSMAFTWARASFGLGLAGSRSPALEIGSRRRGAGPSPHRFRPSRRSGLLAPSIWSIQRSGPIGGRKVHVLPLVGSWICEAPSVVEHLEIDAAGRRSGSSPRYGRSSAGTPSQSIRGPERRSMRTTSWIVRAATSPPVVPGEGAVESTRESSRTSGPASSGLAEAQDHLPGNVDRQRPVLDQRLERPSRATGPGILAEWTPGRPVLRPP